MLRVSLACVCNTISIEIDSIVRLGARIEKKIRNEERKNGLQVGVQYVQALGNAFCPIAPSWLQSYRSDSYDGMDLYDLSLCFLFTVLSHCIQCQDWTGINHSALRSLPLDRPCNELLMGSKMIVIKVWLIAFDYTTPVMLKKGN